MSALRHTARSVGCDGVLQRVNGAGFCSRYGRKFADYIRPYGRDGAAVSGGVETMALIAALGFEEGYTILLYDGANAFNGIYRRRFMPALAEIDPSVLPYAANVHA